MPGNAKINPARSKIFNIALPRSRRYLRRPIVTHVVVLLLNATHRSHILDNVVKFSAFGQMRISKQVHDLLNNIRFSIFFILHLPLLLRLRFQQSGFYQVSFGHFFGKMFHSGMLGSLWLLAF